MTSAARKPLPAPDEDSAPFFAGAREGKLMLMRCNSCGAFRYPSRDRCDVCWSTDTAWTAAAGTGTVYTFGIMHQVYHPGFANSVPYNVAVIELSEGPRMMANIIDCANDAIRVGMPVQVVFEAVSDDVAVPRFRPSPQP